MIKRKQDNFTYRYQVFTITTYFACIFCCTGGGLFHCFTSEYLQHISQVLRDLTTSEEPEVRYLSAICIGMLCATHHDELAEVAFDVLEDVVMVC